MKRRGPYCKVCGNRAEVVDMLLDPLGERPSARDAVPPPVLVVQPCGHSGVDVTYDWSSPIQSEETIRFYIEANRRRAMLATDHGATFLVSEVMAVCDALEDALDEREGK